MTSNVATGLTYEPFGPAAGWTYGNGLVRSELHDLDGRVSLLKDDITAQKLTYAYDANNSITGITNGRSAALTQNFAYDDLGRLITANRGDGVNEGFGYDADGNRTWTSKSGVTTTNSHSAASNKLLSNSNPSLSRVWTYDAFGNSNGFTGADGVAVGLHYDAFGRIDSSSRSGVTTSYLVNALGQRVGKQTGTTKRRYFYGPDGSLLAELNGTAWTDYVRMGGQAIGLVRANTLCFVENDHLGRPEVVTNAAKATVWAASNYAFDRAVTTDTIGGLNLGFPGQYYDSETKLWQNYFRDYDASIGRYAQSDPIGLRDGVNTYAYVGNGPVNLIDPFGLSAGGGPGNNGAISPAAACGSLADRTNKTFIKVNKSIPGISALPGMGLPLGAGQAGANAVGAQTLMQASVNQLANGLANYAGASPSAVNWAGAFRGAALGYVAVSAAFEGGLYIGSAISEGINDAMYGAPAVGSPGCGCDEGK